MVNSKQLMNTRDDRLNPVSDVVNTLENGEPTDGKLISLTTDQAVKYGIADGSAETIDALMDTLGFLVMNFGKQYLGPTK